LSKYTTPTSNPQSTHEQPKPPRMHYLPSDPRRFFPPPVLGPNDAFDPPSWFIETIDKIANSKITAPKRPPVNFHLSSKAAEQNGKLLEAYDFDLEKLINHQSDTTLGYGSEFRPTSQLETLLGRHPHFQDLKKIIDKGMPYIYNEEITETARQNELTAILARGNHKSAKDESKRVQELVNKEVTHGFAMPIPMEVVPKIPGAIVQAMGLVSQWTIDEKANRIIKYRLTQDLSYATTDKSLAVNKRINMSAYPEMIYGWCLPRIIHSIVSLRLAYPESRILITKYDYSDAYRRIAHSAQAAVQTIGTTETAESKRIAFICLRMTFGGSPNPPTWCLFSEMVTDLANEILQCKTWDYKKLHSPAQPHVPEPVLRPESEPLGQAIPMAVHIPPIPEGRADGFIDDIIVVARDTEENRTRAAQAVPLAMQVTSRPHAGEQEPITRRTILSMNKLEAEGAPSETQVILGWRFNTRNLTIALPNDKYIPWKASIEEIIKTKQCKRKEMETIEGRLNHTASIVPLTRHFLGRIRALKLSRPDDRALLQISREVEEDLKLWLCILESARKGLSLNLLTTRIPSRICWSDACPFGIGGYLLSGKAWRFKIPATISIYGDKRYNNLFEFIGMGVNIWLECKFSTNPTEASILALGDNTSAIGWLFKTSRLEMHKEELGYTAHLMVARKVATLVLEANCCLASQHLAGSRNDVADLLSFWGNVRNKPNPVAFDDPPDEILTERFHSLFHDQIPQDFKVSPLPSEISSWITQVLQTAAWSSTPNKNPATKSATGPSDDGKDSAEPQAYKTTSFSLTAARPSETWSSEPFSTATEAPNGQPQETLMENVGRLWSARLCEKPQATWLRRFGSICNQAPCTSREVPTCIPPSNPSSERSTTPIHLPIDKRQSHPNSCDGCSLCVEKRHPATIQ
jgi:hypothetical protein